MSNHKVTYLRCIWIFMQRGSLYEKTRTAHVEYMYNKVCNYKQSHTHKYIYIYIHIYTYIYCSILDYEDKKKRKWNEKKIEHSHTHTYKHKHTHTYTHTYIHTYFPTVLALLSLFLSLYVPLHLRAENFKRLDNCRAANWAHGRSDHQRAAARRDIATIAHSFNGACCTHFWSILQLCVRVRAGREE